jgi:hypothetical protein
MQMTDIKPRYVEGEPVCSGEECLCYTEALRWKFENPSYFCAKDESYYMLKDNIPCIPALRRDRDKWKENAIMATNHLEGLKSRIEKLEGNWRLKDPQ